MSLEYNALCFLRFAKDCRVALVERSPRRRSSRPDVLGITQAGYLLEIEIKRTMNDFRADGKKVHINIRSRLFGKGELFDERWPKQFWYCVPPELAKSVEKELPPWAGLLRGPGRNEPQALVTVSPAPTNKASRRLSAQEKITLAQCMSNQIMSLFVRLQKHRSYDLNPHTWFPQI